MEDDANERVVAALDSLDAWLGDGANGDRWRAHLRTAELRAELAKGADADPAIVARSLQEFHGEAQGLDLAPFVEARTAIEEWLETFRGQFIDDLARLAWGSRGGHAADFAVNTPGSPWPSPVSSATSLRKLSPRCS